MGEVPFWTNVLWFLLPFLAVPLWKIPSKQLKTSILNIIWKANKAFETKVKHAIWRLFCFHNFSRCLIYLYSSFFSDRGSPHGTSRLLIESENDGFLFVSSLFLCFPWKLFAPWALTEWKATSSPLVKWKTNIIGNCQHNNKKMNLERIALLLWRRLESRQRTNLFSFFFSFFLYRRAQSLIYVIVEIAVNDICWECFILCSVRIVHRKARDWERKKNDDGTWSLSETCSIRKRKSKDVEQHITRFRCFPRQVRDVGNKGTFAEGNQATDMSYTTTSNLSTAPSSSRLSLFDRLLLPALILFSFYSVFCAKNIFFSLFISLRVSYELCTSFHLSFLLVLQGTKKRERKKSFGFFWCDSSFILRESDKWGEIILGKFDGRVGVEGWSL